MRTPLSRHVLVIRAAAVIALALIAACWPAAAAATVPADSTPLIDHVDSLKVDYEVTPDGVLKVREEIVYRFGMRSGRHGIFRDLVIREPAADDQDQLYDVTGVRVTSPSGVSVKSDLSVERSNKSRNQTLRIKIGSKDETIGAPTATYIISYQVRGALRPGELYWDATGHDWAAAIQHAEIRVSIPGGVTKAACFTGEDGSRDPCDSATVSAGKARYVESDYLSQGEGVTVVAGITPGRVQGDAPILDDPPNLLERAGAGWLDLGIAVLSAGLIIGGAELLLRRWSADERFAGQPPGAIAPRGAPVQRNRLDEKQLPVAFAPPPGVTPAEGGLLHGLKTGTQSTAATLVDLAVRGALRIDNTGTVPAAVLLDRNRATAPHEQTLLRQLFSGRTTSVELARRPVGDHSMRRAHEQLIAELRSRVEQRQWFRRLPAADKDLSTVGCLLGTFGCSGLVAAVVTAIALAWLGELLLYGVPVLALLVAFGMYRVTRAEGKRSAEGRAVADQVAGFRTYLSMAEADQLKVDEGEDIYSRYLPWAIVFGLADRWRQVCAELVSAGRLPAEPDWYAGPAYYGSGFTGDSIGTSVAQSFEPPPEPVSSGGGSSSGFSGGGFSGGGGGGGGGGSW